MSKDTGIITGHTIIKAPVSIADIQSVLSVNSGDLGTLIKSQYVNKWSKYKPVSVGFLIDTTPQLVGGTGDNKHTWKSSATWYKGSGTCGFEIVISPSFWNQTTEDTSKVEAIREAEAASLDEWFNNGWKYSFQPSGTIGSPFRILDFNYYDHNAVPFIKSVTPPSRNTYYAGEDSSSMVWTMVLPTSAESQYSVAMGDISVFTNKTLLDYHFGLIFVNEGSKFPDYSNFKYRKFIAINSLPLSNSNGKSITLTGQQTAMLINNNNITSEQEYSVYPIITTGTLGSLSIALFGSVDFGSMIVIPNSSKFTLSLLPNELEGFMEGGNMEEAYSPVSQVDYVNSGTYISIINRSTKNVSVSSINIEMEIWQEIGGTYQLNNTIPAGNDAFPGTSFPFTIQAGASMSIPINWVISASNFQTYQTYKLREVGSVTYTKSGSSSTSTATLLSNPTNEPNNIIIPMTFQSHITVDTISASYFYVNIWVENIMDVALDFTWNSILYDIVSYPKTGSGTDYDNVLVQDGNTISGNTERVSAGGTSSVKRLRIEPRYGTNGYLANVNVHSNRGYNVGMSNASAEY